MNRKKSLRLKCKNKLYQHPEQSGSHLEQTVAAARKIYQETALLSCPIGYGSFLLYQLRFTGPLVGMLQGGALLIFILLLKIGDSFFLSGYGIATLLTGCAVMTGMTILPVWIRARQYHMIELELSTRFSLSGLMLAQLIITGVGNLIVLAGAGTAAGNADKAAIALIIRNLLLPYLMTCFGCVFFIHRVRTRLAAALCVLWGVCLVMGFHLLSHAPLAAVDLPPMPPLWTLLCLAFALLLGRELKHTLRQTETITQL